jgi:hypothetical protein
MQNRRASDSSGTWAKAAMIVPLLVFFALGMVIDTTPTRDGETVNAPAYLVLVAARVMLMSAAVIVFGRAIWNQFPLWLDWRGVGFGLLGAAIWIGLCSLELERTLLAAVGLSEWLPARESVNPFAAYDGGRLVLFLVLRFSLLVICVPVAEELFLRGFLMRAVEVEDWTNLPLTKIGSTGLAMGTVYGVATHPGELVAAMIWFSMITWLMVRSGKFWNCVVAHAVTNLILGLYVCWYAQWQLW